MILRPDVDRDEARQRLSEQIELGVQIGRSRNWGDSIMSGLGLRPGLKEDFKKWDAFNSNLLKYLLDSEEFADEYDKVRLSRDLRGSLSGVAYHLELLDRKLASLVSIRDRLDQPEVTPQPRVSGSDSEVDAPSLDLFISHASEDKALVAALADLLQDALQLDHERIRASSVDAYRLPAGAKTSETLKRETVEARTFIAVVSPRSQRSMYVMYEQGARWGSDRYFVPLVTSDLDTGEVGDPLGEANFLRFTAGELHQLIAQMGVELGVTPSPPGKYQRQLDRVIESDRVDRSH